MKHAAIFFSFLTFLFVAPQAFAEVNVKVSNNNSSSHVSVQSESSGTNTVCQNGKCTTTGGDNNTSTVCVNGNCSTTSGDVHYESDNGNTKVNVNNSGTQVKTETKTVSNTIVPTKPDPTVTIDPKVKQQLEDAKKRISEEKKRLEEEAKEEKNAIETLVQSLRDFFKELFN